MQKQEFSKAIRERDLNKLKDAILNSDSRLASYESLMTEEPNSVWAGDYLWHVYQKEKIKGEDLKIIFDLTDNEGKNWLSWTSVQESAGERKLGLLNLLNMLCPKVFTVDEILNLIFCDASKDFLKNLDEFPEIISFLATWMNQSNKIDAFAVPFMELCKYIVKENNQPLLIHLQNIYFEESMINPGLDIIKVFEKVSLKYGRQLCDLLTFNTDSLPPLIFLSQMNDVFLNELLILTYKLCSSNTEFLISFLNSIFSNNNCLDVLLTPHESKAVLKPFFDFIRAHHKDWEDVLTGVKGSPLLAILLLIMHFVSEKKEKLLPALAPIVYQWFMMMFPPGAGEIPYFPLNEALCGILFQVVSKCFSISNHRPPTFGHTNFEKIFQTYDQFVIRRFLAFLFAHEALFKDSIHDLISIISRMSGWKKLSLAVGEDLLSDFIVNHFEPCVRTNSTWRLIFLSTTQSIYDQTNEYHPLSRFADDLWLEQLSSKVTITDQTMLNLLSNSQHPAARYVQFKLNQSLKALIFSKAFPDAMKFIEKTKGKLHCLLLLEACIENLRAKRVPEKEYFKFLMQQTDILAMVRRHESFFTLDERIMLLESVSDYISSSKQCGFVIFKTTEPEAAISARLEKLREIYRCPILYMRNSLIFIHSYYDGNWTTFDLGPAKNFLFNSSFVPENENEIYLPPGDERIAKEVYTAIATTKCHDLSMHLSPILLDLGSLELSRKEMIKAGSIFDRIPCDRLTLSNDLQIELVRAYLHLYSCEKSLRYLYRAIRHARIFSEKGMDDIVVDRLISQQKMYFEQSKLLEQLFLWDPYLTEYHDEKLSLAAFSLQTILLEKLDKVNESELLSHAQRILRWLSKDNQVNEKDSNSPPFMEDFALYQSSCQKPKWNPANWGKPVDPVYEATEKFFEELTRVKLAAGAQFSETSTPTTWYQK